MPPALIGIIIQSAAQYGPGVVAAIVKIFSSKTAPTQADWDKLLADTSVTARQEMLQVLLQQGIDPASPKGLEFLSLVP